MTTTEQNKACAELDGPEMYGVMKRGLWYRPNAKGYTDNPNEAWRLTKEEAEKHNYPHDEPVRALLLPFKPYLISYDAIIPLIQRQEQWLQVSIEQWLIKICGIGFRSATPAQLVEALLRACGKWKE